MEVCEFYVDKDNNAKHNLIFQKGLDGTYTFNNPTEYLRSYLGAQGVVLDEDPLHLNGEKPDQKVIPNDANTPSNNSTTTNNSVNNPNNSTIFDNKVSETDAIETL